MQEALCSGKQVRITTSLFTALQRLRHANVERVLWADAFCINQADLGEKNTQVPLMRDIYSQAERVLIWLGEGSAETDKAFRVLEQLDAFFQRNLKHYTPAYEEYVRRLVSVGKGEAPYQLLSREQAAELQNFDWDCVGELLALPWFTRVWTLQEYVKAPEAVLLCGGHSAPFERVSKPVAELWLQIISPGRFEEIGLTNRFPLPSVWSIRQMAELRSDSFSRGTDIISLAEKHNTRKCKDARDKIFGLLGLATDLSGDDWEVEPRYDIPVEEVYKRVALWCIIKRKNLDILSSRRDYKIKSNLRLPSWVPDWNEEGGKGDMDLPPVKTTASGTSTPCVSVSKDDSNILLITGFVLDKIHRLAPSYYQMSLWDDYRELAATLHHGVDPQTYQQMSRDWLAESLAPEHMTGLIEAQNAVQQHCQASASPLALRHIAWFEICRFIATQGPGTVSPHRYEEFWRTIISD